MGVVPYNPRPCGERARVRGLHAEVKARCILTVGLRFVILGIMLKRYCCFTSDKEAGTNENRSTDDVPRDLGVGGSVVSTWRNNLLRHLSI